MIFDFKVRNSTTQLTLTTHLQKSTTPCPQETRGARCYTLGVCGEGSQYIYYLGMIIGRRHFSIIGQSGWKLFMPAYDCSSLSNGTLLHCSR